MPRGLPAWHPIPKPFATLLDNTCAHVSAFHGTGRSTQSQTHPYYYVWLASLHTALHDLIGIYKAIDAPRITNDCDGGAATTDMASVKGVDRRHLARRELKIQET